MKYPRLVKEKQCTIPIKLTLYTEGNSEEGEAVKSTTIEAKCIYQDSAKQVLDDKQRLIEITGTALFCGDIAPHLPVISSGKVSVFGVERNIAKGTKARNLDGSVNFTRIDLI